MKRVFKEIVTNFCSQCTNLIMYFKWFVATLKLHDGGEGEEEEREKNPHQFISLLKCNLQGG